MLTAVVILTMDFIKAKGGKLAQKNVDTGTGITKKVDDYWETAKRYLLQDTTALLKLLAEDYKPEEINPAHIAKLEKVVLNDPKLS